MPDLTIIMLVVSGLAIAGAAIFFLKNRDKNKPAPPPVTAPQPDVAALQAALKQAIDKLHASTPAVPAPAPVAVPAPAPAVTMAPDGTAPVVPPAPAPSPWPQNAGAAPQSGVTEWTGDFDPADKWFKPGDLGFATRDEMYAARNGWLYKREQAALLAKYGYNAEHPYVTKPE